MDSYWILRNRSFFFAREFAVTSDQDSYRKAQENKENTHRPLSSSGIIFITRDATPAKSAAPPPYAWTGRPPVGRESTFLGAKAPPPRTTATTPPWSTRTASSKSSDAGSTCTWTPAKGAPSRDLRRAANEGQEADPRRSSRSRTTGGEDRHQQTPPTPPLPPRRRRQHTPHTPNSHSRIRGFPVLPPPERPPEGGESGGTPARNRSARDSPKESPFTVAEERREGPTQLVGLRKS